MKKNEYCELLNDSAYENLIDALASILVTTELECGAPTALADVLADVSEALTSAIDSVCGRLGAGALNYWRKSK